ncbi:Lrp/AsnC ligand binding domain-containing protein [Oceanicoccus sagamiensis]|uniref:Leucine-responsive regulatory protein n=1 Tax=Oceanicoccus sagamiensis TaxID=716816 RepID=A0A1X9NB13_9GAMM|nr:Lrp/AsnC ligand binding domain-containing protein [Oceanicoccus sagamiensis]ARN75240.1 leucine-responsive transcriptional regulator [Oceanicoccus sagamiensis]
MSRTLAQLDRTDRRILDKLQQHGRISNVELSRHANLSPTPCLERVKRLEADGFISHYIALLDPIKLEKKLCAYIEISLNSTTTEALQEFDQYMRAMPEVQECQMVAGGFDYLIKIRVKDMQDYQRFLGEQLATTPGIAQTHTYVVINEVKSETAIPID